MVEQVRILTFPLMLVLGTTSLAWPLAPAAGFNLPSCQPVNQTVSLEKDGCPTCHRVETTICSGNCFNKTPVKEIPYMSKRQDVCTYQEFFYKTVELPDCLPGVDPTITYPVALRCQCGRCNMAITDCTIKSLRPDICKNDIPFYY